MTNQGLLSLQRIVLAPEREWKYESEDCAVAFLVRGAVYWIGKPEARAVDGVRENGVGC